MDTFPHFGPYWLHALHCLLEYFIQESCSRDLPGDCSNDIFWHWIFRQVATQWVLGNVLPKKSLGTIGLRRQGDTTDYIPKFQVAKMSLEVAEIRFSNLVL